MDDGQKKHLVVLSGAGISAESGLKTFRDSEDGLWNGYDIEDVATPRAFQRNPALVLDFYNYRRAEVLKAQPNSAHTGLAALESFFRVSIITQNIDDLHERGGSTHVLHLHGEILKQCSAYDKSVTWPCMSDISLGQLAPDGGQMRPFIVWFGEEVPMMDVASAIAATADAFLVVGTSLQVYPAAGLIHAVPWDVPCFVVDQHIPAGVGSRFTGIKKPATAGIPDLRTALFRHFGIEDR